LVLEVKVHSARVMDREEIKLLLGHIGGRFPRLSHLWLDAAYNGQGKGADWVEKALGWTAQIVRHLPKIAPQEVLRAWASERAKEGVTIDWQKLLSSKDSRIYWSPNHRLRPRVGAARRVLLLPGLGVFGQQDAGLP
jgi:hypothetical protein